MRVRSALGLVAVASGLLLVNCQCGGAPVCKDNSECPTGQICLPTFNCAPECRVDDDCGPGRRCSNGGGCIEVAACGADPDCGSGRLCHTPGTCGAPCVGNASCSPGNSCANSGHCRPSAPDGGVLSCGGQLFSALRVGSNILIVLDRSGSMKEAVGGRPKWAAAAAAVRSVTAKHEKELRFGLELFPGADVCAQGKVDVPVGNGAATAIAGKLDAVVPNGRTPLASSLSVALGVPELKDTTRSNAVLLVTDGKETCNGVPVESVRKLKAAGIKTYVVGFGGEVDPATLSQMAQEGGTARGGGQAYYQADNPAELSQAIGLVAAGALGCELQLNTSPADPKKLYVFVNGEQLAKDSPDGWRFEPAQVRVVLQGAACRRVTSDPDAKVSVVYGCPDVTLVEGDPRRRADGGTDGGGLIEGDDGGAGWPTDGGTNVGDAGELN